MIRLPFCSFFYYLWIHKIHWFLCNPCTTWKIWELFFSPINMKSLIFEIFIWQSSPKSWQTGLSEPGESRTPNGAARCPQHQGPLGTRSPTLSQAAPSPVRSPLTTQLSEMNPGLYESFLQVAAVMRGAAQCKSWHMFFLSLQQLLRAFWWSEARGQLEETHTQLPFAWAGGSRVVCCQCANSTYY